MKSRVFVLTLCSLLLTVLLNLAVTAQERRPAPAGVAVRTGAQAQNGRLAGPAQPDAGLADQRQTIKEVPDPQGDNKSPTTWTRVCQPDWGLSIEESRFQLDFPLWMLHNPGGVFAWTLHSNPVVGQMSHDFLAELGTYVPGGTSYVTDTVDAQLDPYQDLLGGGVRSLAGEYVRWEVEVRGNASGAWGQEWYAFSLAPLSTQRWDRWVYITPFPDLEDMWYSAVRFTEQAAPAPSYDWQDITMSRIWEEDGDYVLEMVLHDPVPVADIPGPARPVIAWWFDVDSSAQTGNWLGDDVLLTAEFDPVLGQWTTKQWEWSDDCWTDKWGCSDQFEFAYVRMQPPKGALGVSAGSSWRSGTGMYLGGSAGGGLNPADVPEMYFCEIDATPKTLFGPTNAIYLPLVSHSQ